MIFRFLGVKMKEQEEEEESLEGLSTAQRDKTHREVK